MNKKNKLQLSQNNEKIQQRQHAMMVFFDPPYSNFYASERTIYRFPKMYNKNKIGLALEKNEVHTGDLIYVYQINLDCKSSPEADPNIDDIMYIAIVEDFLGSTSDTGLYVLKRLYSRYGSPLIEDGGYLRAISSTAGAFYCRLLSESEFGSQTCYHLEY